jgi:hypothetical protein
MKKLADVVCCATLLFALVITVEAAHFRPGPSLDSIRV